MALNVATLLTLAENEGLSIAVEIGHGQPQFYLAHTGGLMWLMGSHSRDLFLRSAADAEWVGMHWYGDGLGHLNRLLGRLMREAHCRWADGRDHQGFSLECSQIGA